jgi:hypothetical protein
MDHFAYNFGRCGHYAIRRGLYTRTTLGEGAFAWCVREQRSRLG